MEDSLRRLSRNKNCQRAHCIYNKCPIGKRVPRIPFEVTDLFDVKMQVNSCKVASGGWRPDKRLISHIEFTELTAPIRCRGSVEVRRPSPAAVMALLSLDEDLTF